MAPSEDDIKVLELAFNKADKDKTGKIGPDQMKDFLGALIGPKEIDEAMEELKDVVPRLVQHLDEEKDGRVWINFRHEGSCDGHLHPCCRCQQRRLHFCAGTKGHLVDVRSRGQEERSGRDGADVDDNVGWECNTKSKDRGSG